MNVVEPIKNQNDIKRIINYLEKENKLIAVIFQFGIYSGLRISDILALNIRDVEERDNVIVREQKTGKIKQFPIKENLKKIINDYLKDRKKEYSVDKKEPLFIGKRHYRFNRSQVYRMINKACNNLGIVGTFGTHTMRKTFGYHHYQQFHDVVLLQKIFNHSSPAITLRYIGITQENIDKSYKDFEYEYDIDKLDKKEKKWEIKRSNYKEIEQGLEYLLKLYKKLDIKINKLLESI